MDNLCNQCPSNIRGLCCYTKVLIQDSYRHWRIIYDKPCEYLNKAGRCTIYQNRLKINPKCFSIEEAMKIPFCLPSGCLYLKKPEVITVGILR